MHGPISELGSISTAIQTQNLKSISDRPITQIIQPIEFSKTSLTFELLVPGSIVNDALTVLEAVSPTGPLNCYLVREISPLAKWCAQCGANIIYAENFCHRCGYELTQNKFWLFEGNRTAISGLRKLVAAGLNHDGLLPLLEYFQYNHRCYVLAPFCEGETLAASIKIDALSLFNWILTLGNAVEYLHFHGFYGVDFSMENIFLRNDGPKLAGLWKCKFLDKDRESSKKLRRSRRKDILGFARFLSQIQRLVNNTRQNQGLITVIKEITNQALKGNFSTMQDFMETFRQLKADAFKNPKQLSAPEKSSPAKMVLGQRSDCGKVRQLNEDSIATFEFTSILESISVPVSLCIVADGMGGHQNGEIASRLAVQTITEFVNKELLNIGLENINQELPEAQIKKILTTALYTANEKIAQIARAKQSDMGATVTLALLIENMAYILNVGDCRTYYFDGSQLEPITADHSLVYRLYITQQIEYEEITSHPQRHQILRCLGEPNLQEQLEKMERQANHPYWFTQALQPGDSLLLCSDGLWEMVAESQIFKLLSGENPQIICDELVERANQQGGEDNISVVMAKMK